MCIGSDGIWDEVSNDEAGKIIIAEGLKNGANSVVETAKCNGSTDNMTFLVVDLAVASDCCKGDLNPQQEKLLQEGKSVERKRKRQKVPKK